MFRSNSPKSSIFDINNDSQLGQQCFVKLKLSLLLLYLSVVFNCFRSSFNKSLFISLFEATRATGTGLRARMGSWNKRQTAQICERKLRKLVSDKPLERIQTGNMSYVQIKEKTMQKNNTIVNENNCIYCLNSGFTQLIIVEKPKKVDI